MGNFRKNTRYFFVRRVFSFTIDAILITIFDLFLLSATLAIYVLIFSLVGHFEVEKNDTVLLIEIVLILFVILNCIYFILTLHKFSGTLGQRLMNLRTVSESGRGPIYNGVLRYIATLLSIYTLYIGYIIALFRNDRKTIIDLLSGTKVVDLGDE